MTEVYCRDCAQKDSIAHHSGLFRIPVCGGCIWPVDPVSGRALPVTCEEARAIDGACKPEGRLFVQKKKWWKIW